MGANQIVRPARRGGFRGFIDAAVATVGTVVGLLVVGGFIFFYVENHVTAPRVEFLFNYRWTPTVSDLVLGVFLGGLLVGLMIPVTLGGFVRARRRHRQGMAVPETAGAGEVTRS